MPDRIKLSRAKGWRKPDGAMVVTRATIFGNPWVDGKWGLLNRPLPDRAGWSHQIQYTRAGEAFGLDRAAVIRFYRDWVCTDYVPAPACLSRQGEDALIADMTARRTMILSRLPDLRGHALCCTCPLDQPCHADVLLELANE